MSVSDHLYRVLCHDQNPISARCFDESRSSLFLISGAPGARVEVYPSEEPWASISPFKEDQVTSHFPKSGLPVGDWQTTQKDNPSKRKCFSDQETGLVSVRDVDHLKHYVGVKGGLQVFFIRQRNSYSPLSITFSLFETLLNLKHVSSQFKDYVIYMGERRREVEIAPPKLRWRRSLPSQITNAVECMYGLRYVELNGRGNLHQPTSRWSLRQTVVHYSHCPSESPASWIFITLSHLAESRLNEYLHHCWSQSACSDFGVHLLIHDTAIANWRPYLIDLATEVDQHATQLLGASPNDQGPIGMQDCGERQALLVLDRALLNASVVVKSTADNVRTLGVFHDYTRKAEGQDDCTGAVCSSVIKEQLRELDQISGRIDALRTELQGITNLVGSFLDLSSGFALQDLAKESGKDNEKMRLLTQKSTRDAAAVKVLTILTLIYLPATVVSNFFSTSFVNSVPASGESAHIVISNDWWILFAAAVPLTMLTLYIWYVWMRIQAHGIRPFWWPRQRGTVNDQHAGIAETNWAEKV
jgi:Mg2+ and Co2+ transporter CorA